MNAREIAYILIITCCVVYHFIFVSVLLLTTFIFCFSVSLCPLTVSATFSDVFYFFLCNLFKHLINSIRPLSTQPTAQYLDLIASYVILFLSLSLFSSLLFFVLLSFSLSLSLSLSHSFSLSLSFILSLSLSFSHSISLSLYLSFFLSCSFSLSLFSTLFHSFPLFSNFLNL